MKSKIVTFAIIFAICTVFGDLLIERETRSKDKSSVKGDLVPADAQEDCRTAASSCPVEAISIEE